MKQQVLDHGYIELIETWGSDERIIEAARMSTGKGFLGWGPVSTCANCGDVFDATERACPKPSGTHPFVDCGRGGHHFIAVAGDEKLLAFLYNNKHTTPFEMAGAAFEIKAPIFVFREWHRHRTMSYNEMSARYTPLPDENYIPTTQRLLPAATSNRQAQGTGAVVLSEFEAETFREQLQEQYVAAQELYQRALQSGVPKELARLCLPVGRYSKMRASANLRNWMAFLSLRMAPNAQFEIQQFAIEICDIMVKHFPRSMALFLEGFAFAQSKKLAPQTVAGKTG